MCVCCALVYSCLSHSDSVSYAMRTIMLTTTLVSSPDLWTFHRLHSAVCPPYLGGGPQHPLHVGYPVCDLREVSPGMGSPLSERDTLAYRGHFFHRWMKTEGGAPAK